MKLWIRYFASFAALVLVIGFSMWLPSRFLSSVPTAMEDSPTDMPSATYVQEMTRSERAELCDKYRNFVALSATVDNHSVAIKASEGFEHRIMGYEELPDETRKKMENMLQTLLESYILDENSYDMESYGFEYVELAENDGGKMRVLHFYSRWYGDWNNWVHTYIDADTCDIYYFYVSCQRVSNVFYESTDLYSFGSAESAAKLWQNACGLELLEFSPYPGSYYELDTSYTDGFDIYHYLVRSQLIMEDTELYDVEIMMQT